MRERMFGHFFNFFTTVVQEPITYLLNKLSTLFHNGLVS